MSRSGYHDDDYDPWATIRWRGAVASAIRGKRGQAFLREALAALDSLPAKRLIANDLIVTEGDGGLAEEANVCLIGAVGLQRRLDMREIDPEDNETVAGAFGIPHALACEIMWTNDEGAWSKETPEDRFLRVRAWVISKIGQWRRMVEGDL